MNFRFKVQDYQTDAVNAVADCFAGQPQSKGVHRYRIAPSEKVQMDALIEGFSNGRIRLTDNQVLTNIRAVQKRQNLLLSKFLKNFTETDGKGESKPKRNNYQPGAKINLDVEMETGTGKTYCYIKTMFEMNERYGWSKFIVIVPSVAIREGVYKSFQMTAGHFAEVYGRKARFFIYNSKRLHELDNFASDAGINVMIINIQAFNARGKDNRRIYEELDDFQSRQPIDVIKNTRPILILDEPQKMEGKATQDALPKFNPLMILRYSATHKTDHLKVHRLDALDAYNQKLVKKISVRGVQVRGFDGGQAYRYLEGIEISRKAPVARIEIEVQLASGAIKRQVKRLESGQDLFLASNELEQYRGLVISQIDYAENMVEFTNDKEVLRVGEAVGDVNEDDFRRIQIRETIKAHLDKEMSLFTEGVKVLSLFFIDSVAKYRDYKQSDRKGEYARIFEEEYTQLKDEYLSELAVDNHDEYRNYLSGIGAGETHKGYFSIDKKTKRMKDPEAKVNGADAGLSDDENAYDLILKDKERLLSFDEKTRFIFSHSALREGWDNPNVFTMCMLKHSDSDISRRQEVGRGLRLAVNKHGERMGSPGAVHDINVLTVVAGESYDNFVSGLQSEISEALSARPRHADKDYFTGKILRGTEGDIEVTNLMARQICRYLVKNDYTDDHDHVTDVYHEAKAAGKLAELPEELKAYAEQIADLIDSVFDDSKLSAMIDDGRKPKINPLNDNFSKKEFQELWSRINEKAVYRVDFESGQLVKNAVKALNQHLHVTPLQYIIRTGEQAAVVTDVQMEAGEGFTATETAVEYGASASSSVKYDLIGKIAQNADLTRKTAGDILIGIEAAVFDQFQKNPEHFIAEASRLIIEQKAAMVIELLSYDPTGQHYSTDIFTAAQAGQDISRAAKDLKKHIYEYCVTDSKVEREFVKTLDTSSEVSVYTKLPRGFRIPTPVGDYSPDWAIAFMEGKVRHIYFVAETKGSLFSMEFRELEKAKIHCAHKFFDALNKKVKAHKVKYDVIDGYDRLMDIVGGPPAP